MENMNTECKREYTDGVKRTVVAFANTDGGTLYLGIDDNGEICGLDDPDAAMLQVANAIRDGIRPDVALFAECRVERRDGKDILVVTVQRGTARPYYLAGKGIRPEGVFVRQGASTVPATETAILRMVRETGGDSFEEARSLDQNLGFAYAEDCFRKAGVEFGEAQMRTLHLIGDDGAYTNLALLLSDQCGHTLKLAVFEGAGKIVFKDRRELTGSLLSQVHEAYAWIDHWNHTRAEYSGLERIDRRDYPEEALREALLNAAIHREYAFRDSTLVSLFDDRIEFVNLGGLVKGVSKEDILLGVSALRNRNLADVFYRLRLVEAYGTGMMKIQNAYADAPVKPVVEVSDNAFKITLPNRNAVAAGEAAPPAKTPAPADERERRVLDLLAQKGRLVRRDTQAALGVSQATAALLLRVMAEKGLIRKTGSGRSSEYVLPDEWTPNLPD